MHLSQLGWDERWQRVYEPFAGRAAMKAGSVEPGRVAIEFNHLYRIYTSDAELEATATGRMKHQAGSRSELPAVGDWVVVNRQAGSTQASIAAVLPRRSQFSRKAAGNVAIEQVVAANVDVVFVVMGLDGDFNLRRLERYLLMALDSGAAPVVLLTKPDLSAAVAEQAASVSIVAGERPVHVLSPRLNTGLEQVRIYLEPGRTAALLGSSGVGKSTIINRLAGNEAQRTREVREADSRGRHTTTHRELVLLPDGGLIIDTPGMRELQLWDAGDAVRETFEDIDALSAGCHFTDCRHRDEPRCAVKQAVTEGGLLPARLASYLKLQDELAALGSLRRRRGNNPGSERLPRGRR